MDNLEGLLMVPPERGQILGRAVWKVSLLLPNGIPSLFTSLLILTQKVAICRRGKTQHQTRP